MDNNNNHFGGIFKNIVNNANTTLNSQKAASVKKTLIVCGIVGAAVGFVLLITGMIIFITSGFEPFRIVAGMVLFMVGGVVSSIGGMALSAGVKIVIAGVGLNIADTTDKCPKCKSKISPDSAYCDRCGTPLLKNKLCQCGKQNDINSEYCKACGKKL